MNDVKGSVKKKLGMGAYFLQGGVTGVTYRYPPIAVTVDGARVTGTSGVICNARNYAGSFDLAPEAHLTQPDLIDPAITEGDYS